MQYAVKNKDIGQFSKMNFKLYFLYEKKNQRKM